MYVLKHHVEGEKGLPGNPEPMNSVRYTARVLLAGGLIAGCVGFSGWLQRGSGIFEFLCVCLLIGGAATLVYEPEIQNRLSHWRW